MFACYKFVDLSFPSMLYIWPLTLWLLPISRAPPNISMDRQSGINTKTDYWWYIQITQQQTKKNEEFL